MNKHCDAKNILENIQGIYICCDARRIATDGTKCPYLRLIDIGHVDATVCVYEWGEK